MKKKLFLIFIVLSSCVLKSKEQKDVKNNSSSIAIDTINVFKEDYSLIQGKWQSEDDKYYQLEFRNNIFIEVNNNKITSESEFTLTEYCDSSSFEAKAEYISFYIDKEIVCLYEITGLTKSTLALMSTESGRMFVFNRIK